MNYYAIININKCQDIRRKVLKLNENRDKCKHYYFHPPAKAKMSILLVILHLFLPPCIIQHIVYQRGDFISHFSICGQKLHYFSINTLHCLQLGTILQIKIIVYRFFMDIDEFIGFGNPVFSQMLPNCSYLNRYSATN